MVAAMPYTRVLGLLMSTWAAQAEVYVFGKNAAPGPKTMQGLYLFYVFSQEESPVTGDEVPFVEFRDLQVTKEDGTSIDAALAQPFQVSILLYKDFEKLIDPSKFCSQPEDVESGTVRRTNELIVQKPLSMSKATKEDLGVFSQDCVQGEVGANPTKRFNLKRTGVYVLTFSNCGELENAVVSGTVAVKNVHGYLPANEYHKMPFYGIVAVIYGIMVFIWLQLMLYWKEQVYFLHFGILTVLALSLLEAVMYYYQLSTWNETGLRSDMLLAVTISASCLKSIVSYTVLLLVCKGFGVTTLELDPRLQIKVNMLSAWYLICEFAREFMLSFRFSHNMSMPFMIVMLVPVSATSVGFFAWIFQTLSKFIEQLMQEKQEDKLVLFKWLQKILLVAVGLAAISSFFQFVVLPNNTSMRWQHQWFFADGVVHVLFMVVLTSIMYALRPNENSYRYLFSKQIGEDGDFPEPEGMEGEVQEMNEIVDPQPQAQTIGVSDAK